MITCMGRGCLLAAFLVLVLNAKELSSKNVELSKEESFVVKSRGISWPVPYSLRKQQRQVPPKTTTAKNALCDVATCLRGNQEGIECDRRTGRCPPCMEIPNACFEKLNGTCPFGIDCSESPFPGKGAGNGNDNGDGNENEGGGDSNGGESGGNGAGDGNGASGGNGASDGGGSNGISKEGNSDGGGGTSGTESETGKTSTSETPVILGIVGGAIAVMAVGGAMFMLVTRKRDETEEENDDSVHPTQYKTTSSPPPMDRNTTSMNMTSPFASSTSHSRSDISFHTNPPYPRRMVSSIHSNASEINSRSVLSTSEGKDMTSHRLDLSSHQRPTSSVYLSNQDTSLMTANSSSSHRFPERNTASNTSIYLKTPGIVENKSTNRPHDSKRMNQNNLFHMNERKSIEL